MFLKIDKFIELKYFLLIIVFVKYFEIIYLFSFFFESVFLKLDIGFVKICFY